MTIMYSYVDFIAENDYDDRYSYVDFIAENYYEDKVFLR